MMTQFATDEEIRIHSVDDAPNVEGIEYTNVIYFLDTIEKKRSELVMSKLKELANTMDL